MTYNFQTTKQGDTVNADTMAELGVRMGTALMNSL